MRRIIWICVESGVYSTLKLRTMRYIHQLKAWPRFTWEHEEIFLFLGDVRHRQGRLLGRMDGLGFRLKAEANLETLTQDVIKSSEIEGEILPEDQVRSSIARKLGMDAVGLVPADRDVEGVVEMMIDATQNYHQPLTSERLFGWHAALFPSGRSGMHKITVGNWRGDDKGPMQVVSGPMGRETVHFEAPHSFLVPEEMKQFLSWFESKQAMDPVLKSAIAHFWFVTVHPFDDGNGRIARAIADMQLARSDQNKQRFYSMSAEIRKQRKDYYDILEKTQKDDLDITPWLKWFLLCLRTAIDQSDLYTLGVLAKSSFWDKHNITVMNDRQKRMVNKLMDGFEGKLNSTKWAKINKCSHDTALRDINDLLVKQVLLKEPGAGKNTSYVLNLNS
jgi:Fic family protein